MMAESPEIAPQRSCVAVPSLSSAPARGTRVARKPPRTLLEQLIRAREATYEETARAFEAQAREMGEPATLTVRHLQRLASGERAGDRANPSTRRVMRELFGHSLEVLLGPPGNPATAATALPTARVCAVEVTSHKFIPIPLSGDVVASVCTDPRFEAVECDWLPAHRAELSSELGPCTATVFPYGVLVAHVVEQRQFGSLAELAVWRDRSYPAAREHVFELVHERWPQIIDPPAYVLSTYWVDDPPWPGNALDTALRILCAPATLLDRRAGLTDEQLLCAAAAAEQQRFREGFDHPEIEAFGMTGVAIGYASWSGVSYFPMAPERAITSQEMATFETVVQGLWCYTNRIAEEIEAGEDPVVPDEYGWRFLRACHSRLTTARPQETGQLRVMKDAILATSRLPTQLLDAHAALRDLDHFSRRR